MLFRLIDVSSQITLDGSINTGKCLCRSDSLNLGVHAWLLQLGAATLPQRLGSPLNSASAPLTDRAVSLLAFRIPAEEWFRFGTCVSLGFLLLNARCISWKGHFLVLWLNVHMSDSIRPKYSGNLWDPDTVQCVTVSPWCSVLSDFLIGFSYNSWYKVILLPAHTACYTLLFYKMAAATITDITDSTDIPVHQNKII